MNILETNRTYLRELTIEDAEMMYLLNLDPEVIQYTGNQAFESIEQAREFLQHYDHYKLYGLGRWAVIRKTDEAFLGWCGLKYAPDMAEFDIGFRFFKRYWNQGFATETAKACLEIGFKQFNIKEIVGRAMKANTASINVLEKIGLTYCSDIILDGQAAALYKIKAPL